MISKVKFKCGTFEFEAEISEDKDVNETIRLFKELVSAAGGENDGRRKAPIVPSEPTQNTRPSSIQMTTSNIAAKLGCKSGPDLVLAACAYFFFVKGQEVIERSHIVSEMKNASAFYNESHLKNLSHSLRSLVKTDKLNERSSGQFSLTASTIKELKTTLVSNIEEVSFTKAS